MAAIRVLIVDDADRVRENLRTLLPLVGDIQIAGEACDGREAVCLAADLQPDVILMDLEMPVMDGCEAARQIKAGYPASRVIALTIHEDETYRCKAFQAGVDIFLGKSSPLEMLAAAILERKE